MYGCFSYEQGTKPEIFDCLKDLYKGLLLKVLETVDYLLKEGTCFRKFKS